MRIALLDTYYPRFLATHYAANPQLAAGAYDQQRQSLLDQGFGTSDFYSRHLRALGHDVEDLIVNCTPLQSTWARAHRVPFSALALGLPQRLLRLPLIGPPLSALPGLVHIAVEQIKRFRPDVLYCQDLWFLAPAQLAALRPHVRLIVGQIARIKGARAVGIAGGKEKCDYVRGELGFDECLDHRDPDLRAKLKEACPKGIDVYFENVGGKVFDAVLPRFNNFARVPVCGLIADYNTIFGKDTPPPPWANSIMRQILVKRLTFRGFIVSDFAKMYPDFIRDMSQWLREGKLKHKEFVTEGLESAPEAFFGLLKGRNFGKQLVRVGPDKA